MTICPWTGKQFTPKRGKVFADARARAEFHTATRQYMEALIRGGLFKPEWVKDWWEENKNPKPCTARGGALSGKDVAK